MKIGEKIKKLRKERGITQEQLAEHLGVSFQAVSKWENEIAFPDITLVPALASFFCVTTDYLFDYTVPDKVALKVVTPEKYEDVNEIIDLLRENNTLVVNCQNINKEIIKQIKEKITSDIADVTIKKVAYATFVCTRLPVVL